jgi:hypothetical protein
MASCSSDRSSKGFRIPRRVITSTLRPRIDVSSFRSPSVHEIHQDVDIAARRVEVGTRRRSDDRERRHRMPRARRTDLGRVIGYGLREMVGVVAHAIHLHDDGWSGRTQQKAIGPGEPGPI